jgi:Potential Monad-binding region of RPAP3
VLVVCSRKEMESLGEQKRGWRKQAPEPSKSLRKSKAGKSSAEIAVTGPLRAPVTQGDFERDWRRRCPTDAEKSQYLSLIGADALPKVFKVELAPAILGDILCLLAKAMQGEAELPLAVPCKLIDTEAAAVAPVSSAVSDTPQLESAAKKICLAWLKAISSTGRFSLNIHFMGANETAAVKQLYELLQTDTELSAVAAATADELAALRKAYGV